MKLLITLLVSLGISMGSYSGYRLIGSELLMYCKSEQSGGRTECHAFIMGVVDTHFNTESGALLMGISASLTEPLLIN